MSAFEITVFLSVAREYRFDTYSPKAPMAEVGMFVMEADSHLRAADAFFEVGNKMAVDAEGASYPADVNSLSKGDMVVVRNRDTRQVVVMAVAGCGFTEIPEPTNPIVPLAGSERTSRQAA